MDEFTRWTKMEQPSVPAYDVKPTPSPKELVFANIDIESSGDETFAIAVS